MRETIMLLLLLAGYLLSPAESNDPTKIKQVVECASNATLKQLQLDKARRIAGIDVSIVNRTVVTPTVIGDGDKDLSKLVTPAVYINNLNYCNRQFNYQIPIDVLLNSSHIDPKLTQYNHCPYRLTNPCTSNMKYRRADGSCNNIAHPLRGSHNIPLQRLHPPQYEGNGEPKQHGVDSTKLASARLISTTVNDVLRNPTNARTPVTSFYTGFAQFLAHDISNTPGGKGDQGVPVSCCGSPNKYKCFNIAIPSNDSFYSQFGRQCMGLVRSAEGTDLNCEKGVGKTCVLEMYGWAGERQQIDISTSFVDLSTLYGDNEDDKARLVDPETGYLNRGLPNLLSINMHPNAKARSQGFSLFASGDPKVNEATMLFSANLMFHREHNRVAEKLNKLNPAWNAERIYQETRRIIIAFIQHIVYNEFLPATLSDSLMTAHKLRSQSSGYDTGYDPSADATMTNIAATAAMRFGHSMLNNEHAYASEKFKLFSSPKLQLKDTFWRPLSFLVREMDFNRALIVTTSEVCDNQFVDGMTNHLFETSPGNGNDIVALNIQRGREHGLAPYATWRTKFNLTAPTDWSRASFPDHTASAIALFKLVYKSPLDIDVFVGGVSEIRVSGKTIGPLFAAILANQFDLFKRGDRFWYETNENPQRFTSAQLQEIRKIRLAKVMCHHYDISKIQRNPFYVHRSRRNPRVKCSKLPEVNLNKWIE